MKTTKIHFHIHVNGPDLDRAFDGRTKSDNISSMVDLAKLTLQAFSEGMDWKDRITRIECEFYASDADAEAVAAGGSPAVEAGVPPGVSPTIRPIRPVRPNPQPRKPNESLSFHRQH